MMDFQRISPNQVLVNGPLEQVREAAWYALWNEFLTTPKQFGRYRDEYELEPLIDVGRNIVSATRGHEFEPPTVTTAHIKAQSGGTLVSFECNLSMFVDWHGRRRARRLADLFERVLAHGYCASTDTQQSPFSFAPSPIAAPSGAGFEDVDLTRRPIYGSILAPRRGVFLLIYGASSAINWLAIPLTLVYGVLTLRDYERLGNPGDKWMVIAGMIFPMVAAPLLFLLIWGF